MKYSNKKLGQNVISLNFCTQKKKKNYTITFGNSFTKRYLAGEKYPFFTAELGSNGIIYLTFTQQKTDTIPRYYGDGTCLINSATLVHLICRQLSLSKGYYRLNIHFVQETHVESNNSIVFRITSLNTCSIEKYSLQRNQPMTLESFTDEQLLAELKKRGYIAVIKEERVTKEIKL